MNKTRPQYLILRNVESSGINKAGSQITDNVWWVVWRVNIALWALALRSWGYGGWGGMVCWWILAVLEMPADRNVPDYIPAKEGASAEITGKIITSCGTGQEWFRLPGAWDWLTGESVHTRQQTVSWGPGRRLLRAMPGFPIQWSHAPYLKHQVIQE